MTADELYNRACLRKAELDYDTEIGKAAGRVTGGNRMPYPVAAKAALAAYDRVLADRRPPYAP